MAVEIKYLNSTSRTIATHFGVGHHSYGHRGDDFSSTGGGYDAAFVMKLTDCDTMTSKTEQMMTSKMIIIILYTYIIFYGNIYIQLYSVFVLYGELYKINQFKRHEPDNKILIKSNKNTYLVKNMVVVFYF